MIPARRLASRSTIRPWSLSRGRPCPRFQSTWASSSLRNSHFVAGAAGGLVGAALAYGIFSLSPAGRTASNLNKAVAEVNKKYRVAAEKLQQNTPGPDYAVDAIKNFAYSYAAWIPGGRAFVDAAFSDFDAVRSNHKEDVDKIVNDTYERLQDISKAGLSLETASKAYDTLVVMFKQIADLSGDVVSQVLDNHPQVKRQFGDTMEQLQDMGRNYGPEAKKQVDETWTQIKDIFAAGLSASNVERARKLAEDRLQQVRRFGDEAWKKSLEGAKPYLDKNPEAKELIDENSEALKQGNLAELFARVRSAVESGGLGGLKKYVDGAVDKAKAKGSDAAGSFLDKYVKMITQNGDLISKLQQIGQVADKHKQEGERLVNEAMEELGQVLDDKARKAQDIVEQAKRESKK